MSMRFGIPIAESQDLDFKNLQFIALMQLI